jgi:hypothetical protein
MRSRGNHASREKPAVKEKPQQKSDRSASGKRRVNPLWQSLALKPAKLSINRAGDPSEREADAMAEQVSRGPAQSAEAGAPLQVRRVAGPSPGQPDAAPPSVYEAVASGGSSLEPPLQDEMEQRFGHDLSEVRLHSGPVAEQSTREVNAEAYTVGGDIVFGAGQFAPGTDAGRRLLAHELTHVLQQSNAGAVQRQPTPQADRRGRILSLNEIQSDAKRERARKRTGQTKAKVCRSFSAGAGKDNCPATLEPGTPITIVAEKAGGAWLQIVTPEQVPGFGPKEPLYVMAAFVEESAAATKEVSEPGGAIIEDILRTDQAVAIEGPAADQDNYVDRTIGRVVSAPDGSDYTLIPAADDTGQGISIPKSEFYIDEDPLGGPHMEHHMVYRSENVARAVVADLMKESPGISIWTYYLKDGLIFPTTLSDTTIPNLMTFVREKRDQDAAVPEAIADVMESLLWWYVGARFPIKIRSGGGATGQVTKGGLRQAETEAVRQTEKEALKQVGKKTPALKPSAPAGWKGTLNAFGRKIGWPRSGEVKIPVESVDLAKLRAAGVTSEWAVQQAQIYREVARLNRDNPTAALRADWLEKIAARLAGAP